MTDTSLLKQYRYEIILAGILLLSAFLNFWNVWNQGFPDADYAAAVRSMPENLLLLIFNPSGAAGFIMVDKPPVGLWVQVASAALSGFSGWALVLPQALAGVGSVALVWLILSLAFGKPAGLVSGPALAITPIFVAVSRNGTLDGPLIFVLLLAFWVGLEAARDGSLPLKVPVIRHSRACWLPWRIFPAARVQPPETRTACMTVPAMGIRPGHETRRLLPCGK